MLRQIFSLVRNWHLAEDLAQEVELRCLGKTIRFPETYRVTAAKNILRSWYRKRKEATRLLDDPLDESQSYSIIFEILAGLDGGELLRAHYLEGKSLDELAAKGGVTPNAIKIRLCRATKLLREDIYGCDT